VVIEACSGRAIRPTKPIDQTVAFHDSCYLGRYNGSSRAPRAVARAVPGVRSSSSRATAPGTLLRGGGTCGWRCGSEKRVNLIRVEEAMEVKARRRRHRLPVLPRHGGPRTESWGEETLAVKDVSELVAESLP